MDLIYLDVKNFLKLIIISFVSIIFSNKNWVNGFFIWFLKIMISLIFKILIKNIIILCFLSLDFNIFIIIKKNIFVDMKIKYFSIKFRYVGLLK